MRKLAILTILLALIPFVAYADATPTRILDNEPSQSITGGVRSYNRISAYGTDSQYLWVWGGGNLGSGTYVTQLWRYNHGDDTWLTGFATLPTGEQYNENTSGSWNNLLIATSTTGCNTHLYNVGTNAWTTTTQLAVGDCGFGLLGTAANGSYYIVGYTGTQIFVRRLDMSNPLSAWVTLSTISATGTIPQFGSLVYDPLLDRLIAFWRDDGRVSSYNLTTNTWTNLGTHFSCSGADCYPVMAYWDNALQSAVLVRETTTNFDFSSLTVRKLVFDTPTSIHFDTVATWVSTEFDYLSTILTFTTAATTLPSGNTRLVFGGGHTTGTGAIASRWWTHEQSALTPASVTDDNIDSLWAKIQRALNGLDFGGTSGQLLFAFVTTVALVILTALARVSVNIILVLVGVWNGALAFVIDPLQGIVIVGVLVFGVGGVLYLIRLLSGSGGSSE